MLPLQKLEKRNKKRNHPLYLVIHSRRIKTLKSNVLNWLARVRVGFCEAGTYPRVEMVSRTATSFVKRSLPSLFAVETMTSRSKLRNGFQSNRCSARGFLSSWTIGV